MRYVYLDNFRGFQDALIPVLDVNFCVGENSSGKTSFLSAISLLSSHRFWFEQSFEGVDVPFKHFRDYVSVNAEKQSYFRIGFIGPAPGLDPGKENKRRVVGYLLTYVEREGMPKLACCTTNFGTKDITVYFGKEDLKYRISTRKSALSVGSQSKATFDDWASQHEGKNSVGIKSADDDLSRGYMPPMYVVSVLARDNAEKKNRNDVFFPEAPFGSDTAWIAPIRSKPRRTYDEVNLAFSPDGMHVPYLIRKILDGGEEAARFTRFIRRFGHESGLFKEVNVHKFGESPTSPFELEVVLEDKPLNMSNVGYGVSQGLPVVVEAFVRPPGHLFAIQQPEVHLHPRAQASIGEMIFELASAEDKKFIVETHSDFTIDRFRISLRESKDKVDSQVLFFERREGRNVVWQIKIDNQGEFDAEQPEKYREFFLSEGLRVIGV